MIITESAVTVDGKPFVVVRWDSEEMAGHLTVEEARKLGQRIHEAAMAAETDAMLMAWLQEALSQDSPTAAAALAHMREFRGLRNSEE